MSIAFACATSHAPGITAWSDAAESHQKDGIYAAFQSLQQQLASARVDVAFVFTAEHWANFFLDHVSAFCIGRADRYIGPVEPWLKVEKRDVPGAPGIANRLITHLYESGFEPSFSEEMEFDHGTMVPISLLTGNSPVPIVPLMVNTLVPPQPSPQRCLAMGEAIGRFCDAAPERIALIATGGLSHDPGERNHGFIDTAFDHRFLETIAAGRTAELAQLRVEDLAAAGAGAIELLNWIMLAGALRGRTGEVLVYEPVKAWATGVGLMSFSVA
jgi:aromatic ring-opening dioxygenase catalytic subunit (LigB family)